MVYIRPLRTPLEVAKVTSTAAVLSGNRVALGAGAGWMREEFETLGVDFETRGRRFDESIDALRALYAGGDVEHRGRGGARIESRDQRPFVDQRAAADVDQHGVVAHRREEVGVDEPGGAGVGRRGEHDDLGLGQVVDDLLLALAQRRGVGDLEERAHRAASFTVGSADRKVQSPQPVQHPVQIPGEDQGRKMHQR